MNHKNHKGLLSIIVFLVLFLSFQINSFHIAERSFFDDFQLDSESLVLGRIISDKYHVPFPAEHYTGMGWATILHYALSVQYTYQSYQLIDNKKLPDLTLNIIKYNDSDWTNGSANSYSAIMTNRLPYLYSYIGRNIFIAGQKRIITEVESWPDRSIIVFTGEPIKLSNYINDIKISGQPYQIKNLKITPYPSQVGIQGPIFSFLYNKLNLNLFFLQSISSALLAIIFIILYFIYSKIFPGYFSIFFITTAFMSPWITAFAHNLYWVPFSWFLPAVFSGLCFLNRNNNRYKRIIYISLFYLSIVFKCLMGYEYISTIVLFALAPYIYSFISESGLKAKKIFFYYILGIGVTSILGFITVLLIHAGIRADSVYHGLVSIYEGDIKRRTYGNPNNFHGIESASLAANVFDVVIYFICQWHTQLLRFIPGFLFQYLLLGNIIILLVQFMLKKLNKELFALFITFILPPLSWFILAKAHSFVHPHMNFVLWYFGFVAVLFYIPYTIVVKYVYK